MLIIQEVTWGKAANQQGTLYLRSARCPETEQLGKAIEAGRTLPVKKKRPGKGR